MAAERKLPERWEAYFGPVVIAQFIEAGWIKQWPLMLTADGRFHVETHGFGLLRNGDRKLLHPVTLTGGAESWPGRDAR